MADPTVDIVQPTAAPTGPPIAIPHTQPAEDEHTETAISHPKSPLVCTSGFVFKISVSYIIIELPMI